MDKGVRPKPEATAPIFTVDSDDDLVSAVADSVAAADWRWVFDQVTDRIAGRFARPETRQTAAELLVGLLSSVERKNGWWLAEHAGHPGPDRMQRLLRTAVWDHTGVGDDLRDLVVSRLGHPGAIFVIDETGFLKKGTCSVGVVRWGAGEVPAGQVLFQRRPPEPDRPVSEHPALR
ncbi:MAG TPA: transposase [Mycobacterium sp.]|nr:transposase [Mycobacterium sp.]